MNTTEVLEEDASVNLHDFGIGNSFLDMTVKAQGTKEKINELDFIKTKNIFHQRT